VERQIFRAHIVIGADNAPLQEQPEILDIIRMHLTAYILARFMVNSLVRVKVLQIAVCAPFIRCDQADVIRNRLSTNRLSVSALVSSIILQTTLPLRAIAPMTVILPVLAAPPP
jgi:hypothetical protein